MKTRLILLFILIFSSSYMYSQEAKDTIRLSYIYPNFHENFSAEESWHIHKEAYEKQLKAEGLSVKEIEKKMEGYEKQKKQFIEQVNEQRRLAAIHRKEAEKFRKEAAIEREKAAKQRAFAAEQRKLADIQREEAAIHRGNAEELRKLAEIQRQAAAIQREKAEELREMATIQRQAAAVEREKAEAWRNRFETILTEHIKITPQSNSIKPLVFEVHKKGNLYINLQGKVRSGSTLIEIFNPIGKKVGDLSMENTRTKKGTNTEGVIDNYSSGSLIKTISDAETGTWQIKISPQNSEATVDISVSYFKKPGMDE